MSRRGYTKPNVAGERYDSNAIQMPSQTSNTRQPIPSFQDMMSGGGMPDMSKMMQMMGGMGGGIPGMPPGMIPPPEMTEPRRPSRLYLGCPTDTVIDKFVTLYPNYINSKKSIKQGRRIPKHLSCEDPIADEMSEICAYHKIPHIIEPYKMYPRDWVSGRVRVKLLNDDGSFVHSTIHTRNDLMLQMGEMIPKLQSRKERLEKEARDKLVAEQAKIAAAKGGGQASSGTTSSNKKKGKGKKGRR